MKTKSVFSFKKTLSFVLLILLSLTLTGCKKKEPEPQPKKRPTVTINQLPVKQRPFVSLTPREDGNEVNLKLYDNLGVDLVEYELEYQAGNMIQGAFGRIDFSQEEPPVAKQLLFGSCSKGVCKYDEDVNGGSLTLRFEGDEPVVLKGDFSLQQMSQVEGVFSSRDGRFNLKLDSGQLPASAFLVVSDTFGLPQELEGEVVSGPYGVFSASDSLSSSAQVVFKSSQANSEQKIFVYTQGQWQELDSSVQDGQITASTDVLGIFLLVK